MSIDLSHFTPLTSLTGGILIGLSSALLILLNGRIAGISGIVGNLIGPSTKGDRLWRMAFIAGLLLAAPVWRMVGTLPVVHIATGTPLLIAGLLVGLGTRYASGCTSGHGVCGLSRGSFRSLIATLSFMAAGFVTVYVVHHVPGL